jgi:hypothetical protein
MRCKHVPFLRTTTNNCHNVFQNLTHFLQFHPPPPLLESTSLFFNDLEEDKRFLVYDIFDEFIFKCLMKLKREWFGPVWVLQCMFYESKEGKLDGIFMFKESKNILKTIPWILFFINLVPQAQKSVKQYKGELF